MPDRRPSIFDEIMRRMRREMERGFRFFGEEGPGESFRDPLEEMIRDLEERSPEELKDFVTERETPYGTTRKFGPFVYGFSYSKKPGQEPEIQEFGNIRPSGRGEISPTPGGEREPLTEIVDLNGKYEVTIELPGVKKDQIDLTAREDSIEIKTSGERKYQKKLTFEDPVNPDEIDANFKHGVLTLEIKKTEEEEEGTKIDIK